MIQTNQKFDFEIRNDTFANLAQRQFVQVTPLARFLRTGLVGCGSSSRIRLHGTN